MWANTILLDIIIQCTQIANCHYGREKVQMGVEPYPTLQERRYAYLIDRAFQKHTKQQ